jgi:nucleoside-diphosphate-sugar epimerase
MHVMRVLVIGGTGFIGSHVVRELASRGADVCVLHRGRTRVDLGASVRYRYADRDDPDSFTRAARDITPDVVVDMIAFTEAHARATLRICGGSVRRLVAASSMDVYRAFEVFLSPSAGPVQPVPIGEGDALRSTLFPMREAPQSRPPDRPPEYEKILVERVLKEQATVPATVLRLPLVYGPGDVVRRRTRPYVMCMADGGPEILLPHGSSRWMASRGYVENVAGGIAAAVVTERAANRTYNVADAPALTELDWVQQLAGAVGWRGRIVEADDSSTNAHNQLSGNFAQHLVLDTSRIRAELGYCERVPLEEAVRRTAAWELANPPDGTPVSAIP